MIFLSLRNLIDEDEWRWDKGAIGLVSNVGEVLEWDKD